MTSSSDSNLWSVNAFLRGSYAMKLHGDKSRLHGQWCAACYGKCGPQGNRNSVISLMSLLKNVSAWWWYRGCRWFHSSAVHWWWSQGPWTLKDHRFRRDRDVSSTAVWWFRVQPKEIFAEVGAPIGCTPQCPITIFNSLYSSVLKGTAVSISFYTEDNRRRFLQNVCTHLPNCEVSHPRRPYLYAATVHNTACNWSHDSKFERLSNFSVRCSACWCLWISPSAPHWQLHGLVEGETGLFQLKTGRIVDVLNFRGFCPEDGAVFSESCWVWFL
jgi:hypothetical protein